MFQSKKSKTIILTRKQLLAIHPSLLLDPAVFSRLMPVPRNQKAA